MINPNHLPGDITTTNISYDKNNFILCVPTYSTELGSTHPHGTNETQFYMKIWKYTQNKLKLKWHNRNITINEYGAHTVAHINLF